MLDLDSWGKVEKEINEFWNSSDFKNVLCAHIQDPQTQIIFKPEVPGAAIVLITWPRSADYTISKDTIKAYEALWKNMISPSPGNQDGQEEQI